MERDILQEQIAYIKIRAVMSYLLWSRIEFAESNPAYQLCRTLSLGDGFYYHVDADHTSDKYRIIFGGGLPQFLESSGKEVPR